MSYLPKINPAEETTKITKFIKDTFQKAGKSKAVVAASGGIDSSTTLLLTAKALDPKNTNLLLLPSKTANPDSLEHAKTIARLTKIPNKNIITVKINGIVQKTWRAIKRQANPPTLAKTNTPDRKAHNQKIAHLNRLRLANITARIRMIIIYDQAKLLNALVVGTENRSENLLGYYTRFGDEASDLEPIKHLYKIQLKQLAQHLKVPKLILDKPPSADLWLGQTDEGELGFSYNEADPILYLHFEQNLSAKDIINKLSTSTRKKGKQIEELVAKVLSHTEAFSFKHQLPYTLKENW